MSSANIDPAATLNRALEYAAQNLRVEKLLIQLGLDPSNVTYDAVFNRALIYRSSLLHCADLPNQAGLPVDVRTGRLTVASFLSAR